MGHRLTSVAVNLSGNPQEISDQLFRPQPIPIPDPPKAQAWMMVALGVVLALPTLGLSLLLVRSGWRRLQQPIARPPRRSYLLDNHTIGADRLKLVQDFFSGVRSDLDESRTVHLEIDFRTTTHESLRTQVQEKGPTRRARYTLEWLKFKAYLSDGQRLQLSVCRATKEKFKRKTRSYKLRWAVVDCLRLSLRCDRPSASQSLEPPCGLIYKGSTAQGDRVLLTPLAYYREAKGYTLHDSLNRLLSAQQLLAACIWLCCQQRESRPKTPKPPP
ncbi:hypothetical protein IV102_32670 [bacterium]|nr:hypothetical protein [bacterium]